MRIKTYIQIVGEMLTQVGSRTPLTNFNVGSVIRTLVEIYAEVAAELYAFIGDVLKQAYLATATGYWLDLKAREYGVTRKVAVKTAGQVVFKRNQPRNENFPIPAGSIVATGVDQGGTERKYFTTTQAVLPAGALQIALPVIAEHEGKAYNVGPGAIRRMKTFIKGIDAVENPTGWITREGADEESDESLRRRTFLAWEELARGGTKAAYMSWALSVTGVKNVWVNDSLPRGQGTVDVYILGESGSPPPALIAEVQAVVDANKPITADALVRAPSTVQIPVAAHVTPRRGFDAAVMDAEIRRRLGILFSGEHDPALPWLEPLGVGRDVIRMQVIEVVMSVDGVYNLDLISPPQDLGIAPYEFPVSGTVTLTFGAPVDG